MLSNMNNSEKRKALSKNPRWISVNILSKMEKADVHLDKLLDAEFKSNNLTDQDKRLLNEITNGVIRNRLKIHWVLQKFYNGNLLKINLTLKNILYISIYQFLFCNRIPDYAIVDEAVEITKLTVNEKLAKLVNAVLRNIIRQKENIGYPDPEENRTKYLSVFHSHPEWMVERWVERFGYESTEELLIINNKPRKLWARVNTLRTSRDKLGIELISQKIKFENNKYNNDFISIKNFGALNSFSFLQEGLIYIQDVSAGLAVQLLDPQENERIIDFCAAPGGKTTYIAEKMKNSGEIIAVDVLDIKLRTIEENFKRSQITNIKTYNSDARIAQLEPADRVLVDAPCSGLGTLSKKPDIKWRQNPAQIEKLSQLQYEILINASRHVKLDGVLVYSTCSMEPEENSRVINKFLSIYNNFELERAEQFVDPETVSEKGFIETLPQRHYIDGSFAARVRRVL